MLIHLCPCLGIGAAYPGNSFPTYSSMVASVHRLQFVHSATSMIMFHFFMALSYLGLSFVMRGLDPRIHLLSKKMDHRVTPLRGGPVMTATLSLRRNQNRVLGLAGHRLRFLFGGLLHRGEGLRHVLGAAVPQLDLDQCIGAGQRVGRLGLRLVRRQQGEAAA